MHPISKLQLIRPRPHKVSVCRMHDLHKVRNIFELSIRRGKVVFNRARFSQLLIIGFVS